MELGSTHESIIDVARSGVLMALEHNMLPKPILQEALRCVSLQPSCAYKAAAQATRWPTCSKALRKAHSTLNFAGPS